MNSEAAIMIDYEAHMIVIAGSQYAGEIKKSVFSTMNYIMTDMNVLPMHCSANMDPVTGDIRHLLRPVRHRQDHPVCRPRPRCSSATMNMAGLNAASSTSRAAATPSASTWTKENEPEIYHAIRFGSAGGKRHHGPGNPRIATSPTVPSPRTPAWATRWTTSPTPRSPAWAASPRWSSS